MQIIFDRTIAKQLSERYTVLELETFPVEGGTVIETFCVVSGEKMNLAQLPELENDVHLHEEFVAALKDKNYRLCMDLMPHLRGKFGGELDTFYDEIEKRAQQE